jgi:hypothetical protein
VIDHYTADAGEPLWVTSVWLALKFIVAWLALRLRPRRAFLATAAMVIASTVVLIGWEIILPTLLALVPLLVLGVVVQTAVEAAVLVWALRVAPTPRLAFLLGANVIAVLLSVVMATMNDLDRGWGPMSFLSVRRERT